MSAAYGGGDISLGELRSAYESQLMLRVIASLKGVIGYMVMNPNAVPAGNVALTINGKSPSDPDYPLR